MAELLQRLSEFLGLNVEPDTIRWRHERDARFIVGRLYKRDPMI